MYYFAYGSNMLQARLRQRAASARRVSLGVLRGYRLCFHKVGLRDGSAKCDAEQTEIAHDEVWGVVYDIDEHEMALLDRAEGLGQGYRRTWVDVLLDGGRICPAFLYLATLTDSRLAPFTWYKQHVLIGARENGLPSGYIQRIEAVAAQEDYDRERHHREMLIHQILHAQGDD